MEGLQRKPQTGEPRRENLMEEIRQAVKRAGIPEEMIPKVCLSREVSRMAPADTVLLGNEPAGTLLFQMAEENGQTPAGPAWLLQVKQENGSGAPSEWKEYGWISERDIPSFVAELGEIIRYTGKNFLQWMREHEDGFGKTARQYLLQKIK
ncbi:MAG: hypothetical protein Q4F29_05015 [Lachnospiraceae bacterium]|nr:hypothetical protein [Lachnospiraceae bacterium]